MTDPVKKEDGADDLAILFPEATVTIGDRMVTVREYGFIAGLRVRARSQALVHALTDRLIAGEILTDDVMDVLAEHADLVRQLMIEAADVEADFVDGLNAADGDLLMLTWWNVCGPFFVRQIVRRIGEGLQTKRAVDGLTSLQPSSAPGMGHPRDSGVTPSAS